MIKSECLIRIAKCLGSGRPTQAELEKANDFISEIRSNILNSEKVSDSDFDILLNSEVFKLSKTHWTPVTVAQRACQLLGVGPGDRVLDVGSGCGKFCTIGALMTGAEFVGVEQRRHLVHAARNLAEILGADKARFSFDKMENVDWDCYNAFYLYNPFYEHLQPEIKQDDTLALKTGTFHWYSSIVQARLDFMPVGTKVVTYHGFGGSFPSGYSRRVYESHGSGALELWAKESSFG